MDPFYQIFYPYKKFESFNIAKDHMFNDIFLTLGNKMVWESRMISSSEIDNPSVCDSIETKRAISVILPPRNSAKNHDKYINPKQKDTLFWSIYIHKYGYDTYMNIHSKYDNELVNEKTKIMNFIKANPGIMKRSNYKITNILIQQVISEMMIYQSSTSLLAVIAMSIFYGVNIVIFDEDRNIYLQFISDTTLMKDDETETVIIRRKGRYNYSLYDDTNKSEKIAHIMNTMICVEIYHKPLKPISHYKTAELQSIFEKMKNVEMSNEKKWKKNEIYEYISEKCVWDL
jgi:hypothetical protein